MGIGPGMRAQTFYSQAGEQQLLIISDGELNGGQCDTIRLPQPSEAIAWASLLPQRNGSGQTDRLILQGSFAPDAVAISEIIGNPPAPMPARQTGAAPDPLPNYDAVVFGIDERATWLNGKQLQCSAGDHVAGVQLRSRSNLPRNEQLHLLGSGDGEFRVMIADSARIQSESSLPLGSLVLSGGAPATLSRFNMPPNSSPWLAITMLCPPSAATITIDDIDFHPIMESAEPIRSAWVWQPSVWQQNPEFFWRLQSLENIQEFFITAPVNVSGEVSGATRLRQFVREANARNIRVWAVIGDSNDVLEENRGLLRTRVSAYRRFNSRSTNDEKLAGVQLDIEPYLLPGHNLAASVWRERYLQTIRAATDTAGEALLVDIVMPVWWGTHADWGPNFLNQLEAPNLSITVMNYRTDAQRLHAGAIPFLKWGSEQQRPVRMALETGTLGDETQRIYHANENRGRLWSMRISSTPILVLFNTPQQDLPGTAYSLTSEREFSASNLTFGGDQQQLNALADQLSERWQQWPTFVGIALHGLDEIYAEQ